MILVALLAAALLVALDLGAACLFANSANAQTDLLLFHVHLDDLEVMLLALLERERMARRIDGFGNMTESFDSLGNFDESSELLDKVVPHPGD